jgi:hypothetical protein
MNRFIQLSRKQPSFPFQVAIYRDDRTWSGYAAVSFTKAVAASQSRQVAHDRVFNDTPVRNLNG